jgi:hypothetical protein
MKTQSKPGLEDPVICGQAIRGRKHICAFVDSREEQYEILMPFLRQGFAQSDRIISILDPAHADDYRCRCAAAGIDLAAHEASGKAPVLRFDNTYLIDGHFSADRMIDLIRQTVEDSRENGYPRIRGFGEMHWALSGLPGTQELVEYEARVNDVWDEYQDPILCIYDTKYFSGQVLMDILCTHPKVILNGRIVDNQYYVPPKEFLTYYRKRQARSDEQRQTE